MIKTLESQMIIRKTSADFALALRSLREISPTKDAKKLKLFPPANRQPIPDGQHYCF